MQTGATVTLLVLGTTTGVHIEKHAQ